MIVGVFPNDIVVFKVPDESCRETTGERPPCGDDFGECVDSILRN